MRVALFVASLFTTGLAQARTHAPLPIERWQPVRAPAPIERDIMAVCRQQAWRHGHMLHRDEALTRQAVMLLAWAGDHVGEALPLSVVSDAARSKGVTDGELTAVALEAEPSQWRAVLGREMASLFDEDQELNRIGIAARQNPATQQSLVVVVASRRLLALAPLPRAASPGGRLTLSGSVQNAFVQSVSVYMSMGDIVQHKICLPVRHGHFFKTMPVPHQEGTLALQWLIERGRGPEVAAETSVLVGAPRQAKEELAATDVATAAAAASPSSVAPHRSLLALVSQFREAHGLGAPQPSPALMQLAQAHADDMAVHHFFAHVSPKSGNASSRLRAQGLAYKRVVENLALAADAEGAFADWHHSPSHLQNLLDPRVDAIGIGLRPSPTLPGESLFVLLMARLLEADR